MNSAALFGWWGLFTWIPAYLALPLAHGGRGLSLAASSAWIIAMQAGMWLGYVTFGFISDAVGRKRTYVVIPLRRGVACAPLCAVPAAGLAGGGPAARLLRDGALYRLRDHHCRAFPHFLSRLRHGAHLQFRTRAQRRRTLGNWRQSPRAADLLPPSGSVAWRSFLAGVLALALPETRGRTLA